MRGWEGERVEEWEVSPRVMEPWEGWRVGW